MTDYNYLRELYQEMYAAKNPLERRRLREEIADSFYGPPMSRSEEYKIRKGPINLRKSLLMFKDHYMDKMEALTLKRPPFLRSLG